MATKPGEGNCFLPQEKNKALDSMISFAKDKDVIKNIHDPNSFAETVFETYFGFKADELTVRDIEPGMVIGFTNRLNKIRRLNKQGKLTGKLAEYLYNTSARAKLNPYSAQLMDQLLDVSFRYKGNQDRGREFFRNTIDGLKKEAKVEGFLSKGAKDFKKAVKMADEFDEKLNKAIAENNLNLHDRLLKEESDFYKNKEGKIFNDFIETIENDLPKLANDIKKVYTDKKESVFNAAKEKGASDSEAYFISNAKVKKEDLKKVLYKLNKPAHITEALSNYIQLMDHSYNTLKRGIEAYVDNMKIGMKNVVDEDEITALGKKILKQTMPDYVTGFYPHYRRDLNIDFMQDLMPHMQKVSDSMSEFLNAKTPGEKMQLMNDAINSMKGYLSPHTKGRGKALDDRLVSKNFLSNVKRYVDEVDNFNYVAFSDLRTRQMLNKVKDDFRDGDLDGYGMDVVRLMTEMNQSMKGKNTGFENTQLEAITKTIMAMEFTSKLGFNLRGAMKNSTQWLLNVVEYGPTMMYKAKQFYTTHPEVRRKMVEAREKAGLKFGEGDLLPELKESYGGERKLSDRHIISGEDVVYQPQSWIEKAAGKTSKWAGKAGVFMRKVENKNRADTFEFAYYREYMLLKNNTKLQEKWRSEGIDVDREIATRARKYAINSVSLLHFDYSALSKSKYLRSPAGRVMGQFQHYAYKFMEYNFGLAKNAKNDVLAGKVLGSNAQKAYRMGLTYFLAPAFLEMMTGLNWGNLVEHDSKSRFEQLSALMGGDEDEITKAFYGRGVLTGIIGFPMLSDALAIGNIFEMWNMDDDSKLALIAGYKDYANVSGDRKAYEIIKILNTSMGRLYSQTGPMLYGGNVGAALQFEAGLYPGKAAKAKQEYMEEAVEDIGNMLPEDIANALAALKEQGIDLYEASKQNPYRK
ncbi:hypothetical protein [Acinetobacter sp.]|uniref:hypothetical protein n=1 Tax=Acinetobacter sp. TaxID=472 RepID=UPI000C0BACF2|nr:hypothetical protein [Acinetobacter sp.]MAK30296.1 hypothetical protein [Acinetobacter sp.]QDP47206.1 MAG: hypothetical protein GOVbin655_40 [Prokaryotic dsDNA virus sp.]